MAHHIVRPLGTAVAALLLAIPCAAQQRPCPLSPSTRVVPRIQLESTPSRSALEMVEHFVPNTFEVLGGALALRARGARENGRLVEPLLLLDGVAMEGSIALVMEGLKAGDLARIAVHLGAAATSRFRGGTQAVVEITTLAGARALPPSASCVPPL
jgi:hypothetical protein